MSDHERSPSSRSIDLMAAQASIAIATSSIYGIKEALQGFPAPRSFLERMQHVVDELRCRPVGPTRPSRGQSLKRLLSRRGKALKSLRTEIIRSRDDFTPYRSGKGHDSNSNHDNERAWSAPGSIGEATDFVATPSPHTHPLECKPEPRDDCQYRKNMANSTVLCKRSDGSEEWPVIARDAYVRNLRKREMMAVKAAAGSKYVQEWCLYLKCYSEGRYNLSTPPVPPPRNNKFDYLSAPSSAKEAQRLAAVTVLVSRSFGKALENAERIIIDAKRSFKTKYASISFIERDHEVMIAKWGYDQATIPRDISIGAHAILSSEIMVLADAGKDWRVEGNPLVHDAPYIRFYAGAPLITGEGHAVGVLAIFDPEPRANFGLNLRRKLYDFSKAVMLTYEEASKDEGRQEQHTRSPLKSPIMKSPLPIPVAEKTSVPCRSTEPRTRTQRRIARMAAGKEPQPPQLNNERPMIEDTPPPSDHSFDDPPDAHAVDVRAVISSTVDRVPTTSITQPGTALSHYCSKRDSGIRTPPQTPPRPYLTSVAGTRIPRPTHGVPSNKTLTIAPPPYLGGEVEHSSPTESHLAGSTVTSTPNTVNVAPYRQHDRLPHSLDSLMPVSEATSSLCLLALNLDYDLIYLLRVRSLGSPNYGGDQQSIATQLLFSRGMPDPCPAFNAPLHLQALKSAGGLIYENREQDLSHDPIVFTSGLITPIVRDDPPSTAVHEGQSIPSCEGVGNFPADEDCMGGVVLAVFKKQPGGRDDFSPDVVDSIARAGHALKTLLVDAR